MADAKTRLTKILTQAVGIVDRAANQRVFLVRKSDTNMGDQIDNGAGGVTPGPEAASPDGGAPAASEPKVLVMPGAVKDGLLAGLQTILESVAAVAESIQNATVDDAAEIPTEPLFALDEAAAKLDALADQWIMEEEAAEPAGGMGEAQMSADQAAAKNLAPAQKKAKIKADEMPRRKARLIAKKRQSALKAVHTAIGDCHKALGNCHKDFDGVLKELDGEMSPPKPKDEPKTKSVREEIDEALAPLVAKLGGVETKVVTFEGKIDGLSNAAKALASAPAQLPNGGHEEGGTLPTSVEREPSYQEKLKAAKAAQKKT